MATEQKFVVGCSWWIEPRLMTETAARGKAIQLDRGEFDGACKEPHYYWPVEGDSLPHRMDNHRYDIPEGARRGISD